MRGVVTYGIHNQSSCYRLTGTHLLGAGGLDLCVRVHNFSHTAGPSTDIARKRLLVLQELQTSLGSSNNVNVGWNSAAGCIAAAAGAPASCRLGEQAWRWFGFRGGSKERGDEGTGQSGVGREKAVLATERVKHVQVQELLAGVPV